MTPRVQGKGGQGKWMTEEDRLGRGGVGSNQWFQILFGRGSEKG